MLATSRSYACGGHGSAGILSRVVGGLKSCVLCGGAIPPKLKVARLLYFHHSRCCHCWWRSPAWQTPRRTPQRQRLHRIRSSVPCMVHPAALPVLCSRRPTAEAKKKSRKLKDIHVLAKDERVVKIGKNWDGRPSRRFIQPKTNVSLRRRPLTTAAADEELVALQAGRCLRPGRRRARKLVNEFRFWAPKQCSPDLLLDLHPPSL